MQSPMKHHFLPVFYLKQWATETKGRVVEFSKPYRNVVKPRRVHPDGTGYIYRLYASEGLPDEIACEMESKFLSPVDSKAADALNSLLGCEAMTSSQREAWSVFLASLMCRMPEDVRLTKEMLMELAQEVAPSLKRFYEASKPVDQPSKFEELTVEFVANASGRAMSRLRGIMSHGRLIEGLSAMHWDVMTLNGRRQLLTSDRPVIYTNVLGNVSSHLVVPIGPNRVFIAVKSEDLLRKLKGVSVDKLIAEVNVTVVGQADRYVFGTDDSQLRFVQNRMGQSKTPQLISRLIEFQRERITDIKAAISNLPLETEYPT
ncbi:MAG: hypothetical protein DI528_17940 [Shinella sp.]|nr:MAG: hypothetical protein DI528_17940 [Shinella sp.]